MRMDEVAVLQPIQLNGNIAIGRADEPYQTAVLGQADHFDGRRQLIGLLLYRHGQCCILCHGLATSEALQKQLLLLLILQLTGRH